MARAMRLELPPPPYKKKKVLMLRFSESDSNKFTITL